MNRLRTWSLGSGIVVALLFALSLTWTRPAHAADVGETSPPAQAEDEDKPKDKSLLAKQPADAAVAQKQQADAGPPFYEKWQFWAITGGVVVGVVAAIFAGRAIAHQMEGGDVRPCNQTFVGCFGEGQ
jgi:hypothetical protein